MKNKNLIGIIVIVMLLAVNVVYAENETSKNTAGNTTSNTTTETNTSKENTAENTSKNEISTTKNESKTENKVTTNTKKTETNKKSKNANLKNLGIKPNDFSGFKPSKTTYDVEVPNKVEKIEVYAQVQDSKAEVTGTGSKKLLEGLNEFTVTVTAEDGTEKTYTINVTRLTKEESEDEEKDEKIEESEYVEGNGLTSIKIENATIEPEFQTNTYEYKVKYIGEDTQLNIQTEATNSDYIVEVTGNEDLQEGENIVTILVSNKDGNNVATYQLKVEKKLVDEEAIAREKAERTKILIIAGSVVVAVIAIVVVIIVIIKRRKNNEVATEYTLPYTTMDNEEDYRALLEVDGPKIEEKEKTKEEAKKEYLENYNNYKNDYEEQKAKKKKVRTKGKRYK